ncbi:TonB-dependent receptor [Shewanella sp. NKUCC01_JLK]|uniref:TonB-dependent receptor plug domain-containing protein n=1 Tax=Shewanella sp. NKUCC01_JLK TaxID=2842123 RepID=UPI001C5BE93F|nr:TonB-dependent receptor [Shewanella sp. NKUCC01_JLK]MBW3517180.1 TonB-dependent receptor [Shewanella sp. NKUCC01_JLK]
MKNINKTLIAVFVCGITSPVLAQDEAIVLDAVNVVTGADGEVGKGTPKIMLDSEQLRRFGNQSLAEVLRRLPGVIMTGPTGAEKDLRVRGLDKEYSQILINGRRMPDGGEKREFQIDRIPLKMIERIEFIRSPNASMDSQGIGGTVNIVLKQAGDRVLAEYDIAYGNSGSGDHTGDASIVWGKDNYLLNASVQRRANEKEKTKHTLKNGKVDKGEREFEHLTSNDISLAPSIQFDVAGGQLNLNPMWLRSDENKDKIKQVLKSDLSVNTYDDEQEDKIRQTLALDTDYQREVLPGQSVKFAVGVRKGDEDKDKVVRTFKADGTETKLKLETEDKEDTELYVAADYFWQLSDAHLLSSGVDFNDKSRDKNKQSEENGASKTGVKDVYTLDEQRLQLYVMDDWKINDKHSLNMGTRFDLRDFSSEFDNEDFTSNENFLSPSLHYQFAFAENKKYYASIARTVRLPKFDELIPYVESADGSLSKPDKGGNPDLNAETAWGLDTGIDLVLGSSSYNLNLYYRDIKDIIETYTQLDESTGRYVSKPENSGDAYTYGAELSVEYSLTDNLLLNANTSIMRGEVTTYEGIERPVKELPDYSFNLGLTYFATDALEFGANWQQKGPAETEEYSGNTITLTREESRAIVDVYATYKFSELASLRLSASDLFNSEKDKNKSVYDGTNWALTEQEWEQGSREFRLTLLGRF